MSSPTNPQSRIKQAQVSPTWPAAGAKQIDEAAYEGPFGCVAVVLYALVYMHMNVRKDHGAAAQGRC